VGDETALFEARFLDEKIELTGMFWDQCLS
jgi:hypothetical protein